MFRSVRCCARFFRGFFVFLSVTNVYCLPTLRLTHLKPMEETRDSKKMLMKIKIDEKDRGNYVGASIMLVFTSGKVDKKESAFAARRWRERQINFR